jgi:hypothetical protein
MRLIPPAVWEEIRAAFSRSELTTLKSVTYTVPAGRIVATHRLDAGLREKLALLMWNRPRKMQGPVITE